MFKCRDCEREFGRSCDLKRHCNNFCSGIAESPSSTPELNTADSPPGAAIEADHEVNGDSNNVSILSFESPGKTKRNALVAEAYRAIGVGTESEVRLLQIRQQHGLSADALRDIILFCKDVARDEIKLEEVRKLSANPNNLVRKVKQNLMCNNIIGAASSVQQKMEEIAVPEIHIFKRAGVKAIRIHYNDVESIMHELIQGHLLPLEELCLPVNEEERCNLVGNKYDDFDTSQTIYNLRNKARTVHGQSIEICPLILGSDGAQVSKRGNRSCHPFHVTLAVGNRKFRNRRGSKKLLGYMGEAVYEEDYDYVANKYKLSTAEEKLLKNEIFQYTVAFYVSLFKKWATEPFDAVFKRFVSLLVCYLLLIKQIHSLFYQLL
jgi:hypothetical protein